MERPFEELFNSSGEIEESSDWRVLILVEPDTTVGMLGEFASAIAQSKQGQLFVGIMPTSGVFTPHSQLKRSLFSIYEEFDNDAREVDGFLILDPINRDGARHLNRFVTAHHIDLVLMRSYSEPTRYVSRLACEVGILRGASNLVDQPMGELNIGRILIPTSGGPNTVAGLELLASMAEQVDLVVAYIANRDNEEANIAHGLNTLKTMVGLADCADIVETKVVSAASVISGISAEADEEYDLVLLGANEDALDQVLFGNIVESVVRDSQKPVLVMRRRRVRALSANYVVNWQLRRIFPQINRESRNETYARIRQQSRPEINFYVLIALSAAIAAAGLLLNSPAVVIGAMLVAPLMSPIIGVGMAMVLGETRFLRIALTSVVRGVILAIGVGCMIGLLRWGQPLTSEVLARTQPSLLDLAVALFSGLAAAYAICFSQAAGALPGVAIAAALVPPLTSVGIALVNGEIEKSLGALLLFMTNFFTIASASAVVFLLLGFRPGVSAKSRLRIRQRAFRIAFALLALNAVILATVTYNLGLQTARELAAQTAITERDTAIRESVTEAIAVVTNGEAEISPDREDLEVELLEADDGFSVLNLSVVARSPQNIFYTEVLEIQDQIGATLLEKGYEYDRIGLDLTLVRITRLDPEIPPTPTPTPLISPTPTVTQTPIFSPTPTLDPIEPTPYP